MYRMFGGTTALTNLTLTNFKTTNVTNMEYVFQNSSVTSLDLSNWDVTKVTSFMNMFDNAESLTTLNLTDWGVNRTADTVTMTNMFSGTSALTNLTLTNFKTTNVTSMDSMFRTSGVTSLDLSDWDVTKVTYFNYMFYNAGYLRTLNLSGWNTSGASVSNMFYSTTNLWKITLGENIKFKANPSFKAAPAIGTTIPGTSYKTTAVSWQIVGTGTEFNPQGAMVTTTQMYADRTEPVTYVWANKAEAPTPTIDSVSIITFDTLAASDFFNGNSPLATNMATGSVALKDLDSSTTYHVTVAQTSDWKTDGESATIAKSNWKIKYGTSDLSTGACSFWSGTSATAIKSIAFNHDTNKNFSIWLNPNAVVSTNLLGKELESELTWTLSETP
ncbi:BspA family leucine-rich repeat surface protein [Leuconostoc falkenbergense]|uniref:BspA family leucine-rich repeat surface protein n=1 Tax=Leuconostoc falkenbergense TaxID=2766470 RepID=UPI001FC7C358|nr:BspA family leucine-rich repeat surface protein [Leuconostoc falkenbergense]